MLAQKPDTAPSETSHRDSFFRHSGWLMIANVAGGVFMYAVHLLNRWMPPGQYGDFGVALAVIMLVPNIPLQMILAQQAANALATDRRAEVAGVFRWFWCVTSGVWLIGAMFVWFFQNDIMARLQISSALVWITMFIVLLSLWLPLFWGLLQGKQNFLWLGWSMMSNALARFGVAATAVFLLYCFWRSAPPWYYASGMVAGVLVGMVLAGALGAWHSRSLWLPGASRFDWVGLVQQIVPLFLGFLGFQALFTGDTIFVKAYFSKVDADFYVSAGTLSRALMWLVLPLASVMFPRIVHSAAKSEKTNLMNLVFIGTAILAITGAIALSLTGWWVVRLACPKSYLDVVPGLLPWYVSAMVPLALANVLLNNLLARPAGMLIPALSVFCLALAYLFALTRFHDHMVNVLQVLGGANLTLLALCAFFTWGWKPTKSLAPTQGTQTN